MNLYNRISIDVQEAIEQIKAQGIDNVVDNAGKIYFFNIMVYVSSDLYDNENENFYQYLIDYQGNIAEAIWEYFIIEYTKLCQFNTPDIITALINEFIKTKIYKQN